MHEKDYISEVSATLDDFISAADGSIQHNERVRFKKELMDHLRDEVDNPNQTKLFPDEDNG